MGGREDAKMGESRWKWSIMPENMMTLQPALFKCNMFSSQVPSKVEENK